MKHFEAVALDTGDQRVSVLNREPMGMKPRAARAAVAATISFSAQPRADGDEGARPRSSVVLLIVSVLNREPMGMKPTTWTRPGYRLDVSVLNREPMGMKPHVTNGAGEG